MSAQTVRWGLLSTANINRRLIPAIRQAARSELVAVASRNKEKADAYAARWDIPRAYGSYEALLADPDIDVVYISLPNTLHATWAINSADAGKHILCEKPLALTVEDVDRMAEAARRNKVVLQEAFMYRFHPQTLDVRHMIARGEIGDVVFIRGTFNFTLRNPDNVRLNPSLGGGCLWDVGCYPVSFSRAMLGSGPAEVTGWRIPGPSGVDVAFAAQMRFPGGALAQTTCSFRTVNHWDAEIVGTEGRIYLDQPWCHTPGLPGHVRIVRRDREETRTYRKDAYLFEVKQMEACILNGVAPHLPLSDSRENVATLVALYESARRNAPVRLE